MRLISLNTWGGRLREPLFDFLAKNREATDIFCLQEIYFSKESRPDVVWGTADLAAELGDALRDFSMVGRLANNDDHADVASERDIKTGETIFVRKNFEIVESGGFHTYASDAESQKEKIEPVTGNFQFVKIQTPGGLYYIGNVHGLWLPGSKGDTPKRIEQSQRLKTFLEHAPGKKIICGDFNLQPDTKSIGLLEFGMRDLVKEYNIKTTRNHYYADMKKYADYIADYMFISGEVQVSDFRVLPDEISDHLPLMLEFH
jgi:endonuclease/exonuclease/phosphatase family metal-dependent hydrolase